MSDRPGSPYGLGPYSAGPYSRNPQFDVAANQLSATQVAVVAMAIRNAYGELLDADQIGVNAEILWQKIAIPPCGPWFFITAGACYRALPCTAGAIFPGVPS